MAYTSVSKENIIKWLKENLSEERFLHSLGTAQKAAELARKYGEDEEKAYIAGLLHDCAKCMGRDKLRQIIDEQLKVNENELMNCKTHHAPVSAHIAEKEFGVIDPQILSAIRWHTLGHLDMSTFEKIVFLADKIEPGMRDPEYIEKIQKILEKDDGLNRALLKCYKETIKSLLKRKLKICMLTIEIYNQLLDKTEQI
jgi:predicted HD superfamily hydrolase involved in NAD metabolism